MIVKLSLCRSGSVQSVETVGNSEGTATTETSQTPSCRALAGSSIIQRLEDVYEIEAYTGGLTGWLTNLYALCLTYIRMIN